MLTRFHKLSDEVVFVNRDRVAYLQEEGDGRDRTRITFDKDFYVVVDEYVETVHSALLEDEALKQQIKTVAPQASRDSYTDDGIPF